MDEIFESHEQKPPLFDCQGSDLRVLLHGMNDGSLALEMMAKPEGNVGTSSWLGQWSDVRTGFVIGQAGGHQGHLRLTSEKGSFILFEGEDGRLADLPGRTYAGVVFVAGADMGEAEEMASCAADQVNAALLENIRKSRAESGRNDLLAQEEPDSPFNGWF